MRSGLAIGARRGCGFHRQRRLGRLLLGLRVDLGGRVAPLEAVDGLLAGAGGGFVPEAGGEFGLEVVLE